MEKEFDCTAAWRIIGQMLNEPESVIGHFDGTYYRQSSSVGGRNLY